MRHLLARAELLTVPEFAGGLPLMSLVELRIDVERELRSILANKGAADRLPSILSGWPNFSIRAWLRPDPSASTSRYNLYIELLNARTPTDSRRRSSRAKMRPDFANHRRTLSQETSIPRSARGSATSLKFRVKRDRANRLPDDGEWNLMASV